MPRFATQRVAKFRLPVGMDLEEPSGKELFVLKTSWPNCRVRRSTIVSIKAAPNSAWSRPPCNTSTTARLYDRSAHRRRVYKMAGLGASRFGPAGAGSGSRATAWECPTKLMLSRNGARRLLSGPTSTPLGVALAPSLEEGQGYCTNAPSGPYTVCTTFGFRCWSCSNVC